jgi:hypothetical protein
MSAITPPQVNISEYEVSEDQARYPITASKITFLNLGAYPVYVGLVPVMPADVYQVNIEHPQLIRHNFSIRFDETVAAVSAAVQAQFGLKATSYLVIQTMQPQGI